MTILLALPVGLLIGLSLGALGAGGSILTVPALVYLLGQTPHQATTMSLLVVGGAALAGVGAHWRAGRVRLGPGLVFGLLGSAGSVLGSKASALADPDVLLLGFAGLMVAAAVAMLTRVPKHAAGFGGGAGGGVAGVLFGDRVASRVSAQMLTTAFAIMLLAVGAYTATQSLIHL